MPHRHRVVAERTADPAGSGSDLLILHASWGGRVLRPLTIALAAAWHDRFGIDPEVMSTDDCLMIQVPAGFAVRDLLALIPADRIDRLIRSRLAATGFFGARFRENAARALLLPRANLRERMPLWLTRLRAKKLLETVSSIPDFPILVETWRTCLCDFFDLTHLVMLLGELEDGVIALHEAATATPSPFAEGLVWSTTNVRVYADDAPHGSAGSPSDQALAQVMRSPELRPQLPAALVATFQAKLQRLHPGYAPADADEIADLVADRVLVVEDEWRALLDASMRDHQPDGFDREAVLNALSGRLLMLRPPGAAQRAVVAVTSLPRLLRCWGRDLEHLEPSAVAPVAGMLAAWSDLARQTFLDESEEDPQAALAQCLCEWLRFHGPIAEDAVASTWGLAADDARRMIDALADDEVVVREVRIALDDRALLCDSENYERLLRLTRSAQRPRTAAVAIEALPWFLARWQGVASRGGDIDAMQEVMERLFGCAASAPLWESDILPARLSSYQPAWLDSLLQGTDLLWFGTGRERIGFCFRDALPLFDEPEAGGDADLDLLFPDADARYEFFTIQKQSGLTSAELTARLWDHAWQGRIANDGMAAVRQGILHGFKAQPIAGLSAPRTGLRGWQSTRPLNGAWFRLRVDPPADPLEGLERDRDRVRQLLEHYGILFREILANEPPLLQWARLLPAMRLMELSGEIVAGEFFTGISGLQFTTMAAVRRLGDDAESEDTVYWLNAADPASCCGLRIDGLRGHLPPRVVGTHVIYHGRRPVVVSRRGGRQLDLAVDAADPALPRYLAPMREWLQRAFRPMKSISVESINGESALASVYAPALIAWGFHRELKHLVLRRTW
ncbi:MAG: hypothetical protein H0W83_15605 [Planctomycetes bacterium]|nr:hypothetical protein [Planctomycetota bacterium]